MKVNFPAFSQFPPNLRQEIIGQILAVISRGENLQLIGLPGSGKSIVLSSMISSPQILKFHLGKKVSNFQFFYLDLNLIPEKSISSLLYFLLYHLEKEATLATSTDVLVGKIEGALKKILTDSSQKLVFILDEFDNLADPALASFFKILSSLHHQHRFSLCFIFAVNREISTPKALLPFGYLGNLISENLLFMPPLTQKDAFWFMEEQARQLGKKISLSEKEKVLSLSGGYMRTIKRLVQALATGQSLAKLAQNPSANIHLDYHFEQLLEVLTPEKETLRNLVLGKSQPADEKNYQTLKNLYLWEPKQQFTYPLFLTFLKSKFSLRPKFDETLTEKISLKTPITANEHKALVFLLANQGQICPREKLATAIWGENASLEITDHALDQLTHRLRKKLFLAEPPVNLETIRGRGHRLVF